MVSSSGKGQSLVKSADELEHAWEYGCSGSRYHYVPGKNEAMSMAKSAILQKEFRNERKMLDVSYRMFRFMVNPKQALIAEAKRLVKDALTGKI